MVSIIINGSLETCELLCAATRVVNIVRLLLTTAVKSGPLCNFHILSRKLQKYCKQNINK